MQSESKRPREEDAPPPPTSLMGYSPERFFTKLVAVGELIVERDALKARLDAAEATIAQQAATIAEMRAVFEGASARFLLKE